MNGKGCNPRPLSVSRNEFARRYDETFGVSRKKQNDRLDSTVDRILENANEMKRKGDALTKH